ncbi:L-tyrosine decarboxylase-like [Bolinopsis microptera]|uniref:L-tyrosine decarboxylase-like n=1 Tax=Bolinopsis microptera TaxID=2820187 RepID=UPI00307A8EC7
MSVDRSQVFSSPLGGKHEQFGERHEQQWKALSAWFLGPRAENKDVFMDIFQEIFEGHIRQRYNNSPSDPAYINKEMKSSPEYRKEIEDMKEELMKMQTDMEGNIPFFSPRYQGQMNWDMSMPGLLGYITAMLCHQNNKDFATKYDHKNRHRYERYYDQNYSHQTVRSTPKYEQLVGEQLCDMLGYNVFPERKEPFAWGHVTSGGSAANIEAVWASRNMKFVPMAVKSALLNADAKDGPLSFLSQAQIDEGLKTTLLVYRKESDKREATALKDCSNWQLLNVDVDEICDLVKRVDENMSLFHGSTEDIKFHELVEREGIMSLGFFDFFEKHGLEKAPVYTAPAHNHYSWSKAGNLLGLGSDALIPIQLDVNFRQSVDHLREKLEGFLKAETPVLSVIAVMGSAEESAVDPIKEIYQLREEFKGKGLNFAILADGVWGGYFKTMLMKETKFQVHNKKWSSERQNERQNERHNERSNKSHKFDGFVPHCEMSDYVHDQFRHIEFADSITVDPHKSGFCPYPGGALCYRNGKMRYPIAHFHREDFHGDHDGYHHDHRDHQDHYGYHHDHQEYYHDDHHGIEGSKPVAASAGIWMSHNVIGLSNRGYGRILGQCTATAKLFYSMWLTMAREDDPFVCVPLQQLPKEYNMENSKQLINDHIAYKPMEDIYNDQKAKHFLKDCGPDTTINTFVVNFKNNKDVKETNKLQWALSDAMNFKNNKDAEDVNKQQIALSDGTKMFVGTNARRIPLMITHSGLDAKKHGEALKDFKKRVGLAEDDEDMNVLINTCMNPWQWNESIFTIREQFRMIVLNCMGRVKDNAVTHKFTLSGSYNRNDKDESIFIEYLTDTDIPEHQYQGLC